MPYLDFIYLSVFAAHGVGLPTGRLHPPGHGPVGWGVRAGRPPRGPTPLFFPVVAKAWGPPPGGPRAENAQSSIRGSKIGDLRKSAKTVPTDAIGQVFRVASQNRREQPVKTASPPAQHARAHPTTTGGGIPPGT